MARSKAENEGTDSGADAFVSRLFDTAYSLREGKSDLLKKIDANRQLLRNLWQSGELTEEQTAEAFELYPTLGGRPKSDDAEEGAEGEPVTADAE